MLIDFSFSNYRSYRDDQQFSMRRPTNAQKRQTAEWPRKDISTVAGIYGGNASGKSAFMEAFRFLAGFVTRGADSDYDLHEALKPFLLDDVSHRRPTEFLAEILGTDGRQYCYELSIENGAVSFESLRAYRGRRSYRIYEREIDGCGKTAFRYGREFSGSKKTLENMAKPQVAFLSTLYMANVPLAMPVYGFFKERVGFYKASLFDAELFNLRRELTEGTPTARALAALMAQSGLGISVVQNCNPVLELQESGQCAGNLRKGGYEELASGLLAPSMPDAAPEERHRKARCMAGMLPLPSYSFRFTHQGADGYTASFTEAEESEGTLAVLAFFSLALRLLGRRSVGFIDEIDASLHPNYVEELVSLFRDLRTNPHQSQLIFTTHDVSLITRTGADDRLLDQDQIWLVEKATDGSSAIYPVTSVASTRWEENFGRNYLNGVYGASPHPGFHEAFAQIEEGLKGLNSVYTAETYGGDA